METPYLPQSIFAKDFERTYEPAEDTFILLDAIEKDLKGIEENTLIGLECGSGSGAIITIIAKTLVKSRPRLMIATDISFDACKTTSKCAKFFKQDVQIVRSNLLCPLIDRLNQQVDLLIFNPPYVPTTADETLPSGSSQLNLSWAGGASGRSTIDRFLNCIPSVLSKPHGVAYLVAIRQNNPNKLKDLLNSQGIKGTITIERKAGSEYLSVIRYNWVP